jgi:hypothetical protein
MACLMMFGLAACAGRPPAPATGLSSTPGGGISFRGPDALSPAAVAGTPEGLARGRGSARGSETGRPAGNEDTEGNN